MNNSQPQWYISISTDLGCLLLLPLDTKFLSVYTIVYPPQRRNHNYVDSLLETTILPNTDQDAPDLGTYVPLGLIVSTTYQLSLLNTDLLKIPVQNNMLVKNINLPLMY